MQQEYTFEEYRTMVDQWFQIPLGFHAYVEWEKKARAFVARVNQERRELSE